MSRFLSLLFVFCLALAGAPAWAAPSWPQTTGDVSADPAVRFGVLANGMRYAVMRNATPGGVTALRLRVGSGSLEESDAEQGLAHVLEHMAFRGSTHVKADEMLRILERKGLAFGPDTNAETGWTQTVYMLDLPRSDPDTLSTGLMLLRETASELNIDPTALATERGVVLSEERLRDTPGYRAEKAQVDLLANGQLATRRWPIGPGQGVETAPASLVREFYRANYRPDRTTLIAVGDFDPEKVEAEIKARYSNWAPVGPETAAPDLGQVEKRGLTVKVVQMPGASTQTQIAWARPYDGSPDTAQKRRRDNVEALGLAVLNRRLNRLAQGDKPPFLEAQAGFQNLFRSVKVAIVEASSAPEAWRPALGAIDQEVRRIVSYGIGQDELDREIAQSRAGLANAVAGVDTRPTPELAAGLVDGVDNDEIFTSPIEDLRLFNESVKGLSASEVDAALRAVFAGSGPLVELATPLPVDESEVVAEYAKAQATPAGALAVQGALTWPYTHFGPEGVVAQRGEIGDMGAATVRFKNGVGLIVKPTAFRKDQILVAVNVGGGRLQLPLDHPTVAWATGALIDGGFRAMSLEDTQRVLSGKIYGVNAGVGDSAFELRGVTRPQDLATQMQVMTAYASDPGFRPEAFERIRSAFLTALPQLEATPDGVLSRDLEALLRSGDPRWRTPDAAQLTAAEPDDLAALLRGSLAGGPVEITIVGDVTVDQAIAEVAKTFGALPVRPQTFAPPPGALALRFPAPTAVPVTRTDTGRADQAMAVIAWPLTDFFVDTAQSRATMLAGEVLQNRVLDEVRIAQGATYSPDTRVALSETFPDYGVALTSVEMPPAKIPGFFADVSRIAAAMRNTGVTADELDRARNPRVSGIRKAELTNEYWLSRLAGALDDPRRLKLIRTTFPDYEKVTPQDVQAAAKRWFVDDKSWKMVVSAAPK